MAFTELEIKLIAEVGDLNAKLKEATRGVEGWATKNVSTIRTVGNSFIALGTAITGVIGLSLREFSKFSQAMANLGTDETVAVRKQLTEGVKDLASTFGVSADILANSLDAIQNVTGDAAKSITILTDATKLSVAENADLLESSNAILNLMKVYGDELENTADASDLLFKATEKSKDGFNAVANGLSSILPVGKQLGVNINDLTSLFTNASTAMGDAQKATFGLKAILGDLASPSQALTKWFKELGVETRGIAFESGKMAIDNLGLMDVLERLSKLDAERLDSLISNRKELIALTPILKDLNKVRQDSADFQDREGSTAKGLAVQMAELSRQTKIVTENVKLQAVEIGQNLVPIVQDFVNAKLIPWLQNIKEFTKTNPEATASMVKFFAVLGPGLIILGSFLRTLASTIEIIGKFKGLNLATAGPIAGLIVAIPIVVGMLIKMGNTIDDITAQNKKLSESFDDGTVSLREQSKELREIINTRTDLTEADKAELAGSARRLDILRLELEMELQKKDRKQETIDLIFSDISAEKQYILTLEERLGITNEVAKAEGAGNVVTEDTIEFIEKKNEALKKATQSFIEYAQQFDQGKIKEDAFREGLRGIIAELANTVGGTEQAIALIQSFLEEDFTADILINPPNPTVIENIKAVIAQLHEDIRLLNADADDKQKIQEQIALERRLRDLEAIVTAEKIKTQTIIEIAKQEFEAIQDNAEKIAEQKKKSVDSIIQDATKERDTIIKTKQEQLDELIVLVAEATKLEEEKSKTVIRLAEEEVKAKNKSTDATKEQTKASKEATDEANKAVVAVSSISGSIREALNRPFMLGQIQQTKGSFAEGTNFVPTTGNYRLHKGEQVVPVSENPFAKGGANGGSGSQLTIINLFDKESVPQIMAQYPNATLNIVNKDILTNGATRRVIRSVG